MDWYIGASLAVLFLLQQCYFTEEREIEEGRGPKKEDEKEIYNNPFSSYKKADPFIESFVYHVIENYVFDGPGLEDLKDITNTLKNALKESSEDLLKKNSSTDDEANVATTKARTAAFLSAIAELIVAEKSDTYNIKIKTQLIVRALEEAFQETSGKVNQKIITQLKMLVILLSDEEDNSKIEFNTYKSGKDESGIDAHNEINQNEKENIKELSAGNEYHDISNSRTQNTRGGIGTPEDTSPQQGPSLETRFDTSSTEGTPSIDSSYSDKPIPPAGGKTTGQTGSPTDIPNVGSPGPKSPSSPIPPAPGTPQSTQGAETPLLQSLAPDNSNIIYGTQQDSVPASSLPTADSYSAPLRSSSDTSTSAIDFFPDILDALQSAAISSNISSDFKQFANELLHSLSSRDEGGNQSLNCCKTKLFIEEALLNALHKF